MTMAPLLLACVVAIPVPGALSRPFSPPSHLGVDISVAAGTPVLAIAGGRIHFSGTVAGNRAVSVAIGDGLLLTYSYLSVSTARQGDEVAAGQVIGFSGYSHGAAALHLSARTDGDYVDPRPWLWCSSSSSGSLRLLPPWTWAYPHLRAPRPARRNLRPAASGPSGAG